MKKILILIMLFGFKAYGQIDTVNIGTGDPLRTAFIKVNRDTKRNNNASEGLFNVLDYDAAADGTDDQPEIQAALDACETAGGGVVYLPTGTYYTSSALRLPGNTVVMGAGWETKILARSDWSGANSIFLFKADASNITIKDISLSGESGTFVPKNRIFGIRTYDSELAAYTDNHYVTLDNVEITKMSNHGISIEGVDSNWEILNSYIHDTGDTLTAAGIYVDGVDGLRIDNTRADSCYQHGLYFAAGENATITNSHFRYNCQGLSGGGASIRLDSTLVLANNHFTYNLGTGLILNSNRLSNFTNQPMKNLTVTGNNITNNLGGAVGSGAQNQVLISGAKDLVFAGNTVGLGSGTEAIQRGIYLYSDNKNLNIIGNIIYAEHGVGVNADSLDNVVIGNNLFGGDNDGTFTNAIHLQVADVGDYLVIANNHGKGMGNGVRMDAGYYITNTYIENNTWTDYTNEVYNLSTITPTDRLALKLDVASPAGTGTASFEKLIVGDIATAMTRDSIKQVGEYYLTFANSGDTIPPYIPQEFQQDIEAITTIPTIHTAAGDTSNYPTPDKAGDIFIDTSASKVYVSKGESRGDWLILNVIILLAFIYRRKR